LNSYESQNENWYEFKNEEEKADEKTNIIGGKTSDVLSIVSLLKVFDSLVSGAAGVAKAIDDNKAT